MAEITRTTTLSTLLRRSTAAASCRILLFLLANRDCSCVRYFKRLELEKNSQPINMNVVSHSQKKSQIPQWASFSFSFGVALVFLGNTYFLLLRTADRLYVVSRKAIIQNSRVTLSLLFESLALLPTHSRHYLPYKQYQIQHSSTPTPTIPTRALRRRVAVGPDDRSTLTRTTGSTSPPSGGQTTKCIPGTGYNNKT